jgi:hypothetical protein
MSPFIRLRASGAAAPSTDHSLPQAPDPVSEAPALPARPNAPRLFAFTIRAIAEAETLPRLLTPFSKRGLVPKRFSSRAGLEPGWMSIWVEAELPSRKAAESIASSLRGSLSVDAVLVEETQRLTRHETRSFGAFAAG